MKVKYNKSVVLKRAWKLFKAQNINTSLMFGECLKQSWNIEKNGTIKNDINDIYAKHYNEIYYFILNKVNLKSEIAQELTNDTFIKVNNHLNVYDVNKAKLRTWIYTIAKNIVIDFYRTNKKQLLNINISNFVDDKGHEFFELHDSSESDVDVMNNELSNAINCALDKLKPLHKEIIKLFYYKGLKYQEIADKLSISIDSVKVHLHRTKAKLQELLQNEYTML
jgi:RNA polymerase sigma-70 factor (ECF subfamily)